jgi:acid phosphatase type 7
VISCATGSPQERWLRADLAAHRTACTLAFWHNPRFTSRLAAPSTASLPFWQALQEVGAEIVLNGHVHNYERFDPQRPDGTADPAAIRQFVVGSGGHSLEATLLPGSPPAANSALRTQAFGVLVLTLKPSGYDWQFLTAAGQAAVPDSGSAACH